MRFSDTTVKWMRDEIDFSRRQAKAARETEARQIRAAEEARDDAEWHDWRIADLTALLEHIAAVRDAELSTEVGESR